MLFRTVICVFISVYFACQPIFTQEKGTVYQSLKTESKTLHRSVEYSVYLPPNYKSGKYKYPVIYLLHGFDGDETSWLERTMLAKIADSLISRGIIPEVVIIMPDGGNSYFINDYASKNKYEDFFIGEFISYIESKYRIQQNKNSRAVCGLSMGGFGAIILSMKHPEVFGYSIAYSAAVRTPDEFAALPQAKYDINFGDIYGKGLKGNKRITEHWKKNSPYFLVDSLSANKLKTIQWYIDCGSGDFLFSSNKAFHELLDNYKIPHKFISRPGAHDWQYWHSGFIKSMVFLGNVLPAQLISK